MTLSVKFSDYLETQTGEVEMSSMHKGLSRLFSTSSRHWRQDLGGNVGRFSLIPLLLLDALLRNPFGNNIPKKYALLKQKQKAFNLDNGLRVHERGKTDAVVYNLTMAVFVLGTVEWCRVFLKMAYPNGIL